MIKIFVGYNFFKLKNVETQRKAIIIGGPASVENKRKTKQL